MVAAGEVQRNLSSGAGRDDTAGQNARTLVRRFAHQAQHAHAGVVVMQHLALRRLADQLIAHRFDQLGGIRDHFPLGGRGSGMAISSSIRSSRLNGTPLPYFNCAIMPVAVLLAPYANPGSTPGRGTSAAKVLGIATVFATQATAVRTFDKL